MTSISTIDILLSLLYYNWVYSYHQQYTVTINSIQLPSTVYSYHQQYTVTINSIQLPSAVYSYHQQYTVTISSIQLPSTIYSYHQQYTVTISSIQLPSRVYSYHQQYTVTINSIQLPSTLYSYHQHNCVLVFQSKVGYLHARSVKRQTDIVYVEVCSLMVHSEQVLLVLTHPLWETHSVLQHQRNNSKLQHKWYLWMDCY